MSCPPCPCGLNWPVDAARREPCTSEKAWLDYAVRLLSREAVCRGRGQEAVWGNQPLWWASEVGLPWKNPTANPKDTKEDLQKKYSTLEARLTREGRFPSSLEEEAHLWKEGRMSELFLLTALTSLLTKASGVHSAAIRAKERATQLKAEVTHSLVRDIRGCLSETLKVIDNLCPGVQESVPQVPSITSKVHESVSQVSLCKNKVSLDSECRRNRKRSSNSNQGLKTQEPKVKIPKVTQEIVVSEVYSPKCFVNSKQKANTKASITDITSYSKKLLQKQQHLKKDQHSTTNSFITSETESTVPSICLNLSESDIQKLLQGQTVPFPNQSTSVPTITASEESIQLPTSFLRNVSSDSNNINNCLHYIDEAVYSNLTTNCNDTTRGTLDLCKNSVNNSLIQGNRLDQFATPTTVTLSNVNEASHAHQNKDKSDLLSTIVIPNVFQSTNSPSFPNSRASDHGYGSDEGMNTPEIDIDELFSQEEQSQILQEDDLFFSDNFFLDL